MTGGISAVREDKSRRGFPVSRRHVALILILVVDVGFILWGGMAALAPDHLPGPGNAPILTAGYEGFTGGSWRGMARGSPATAGYLTLLWRVYGAYNVGFGVLAVMTAAVAFRRGEAWAWWTLLVGNIITLGSAMTYDRLAHAIGPFEISEYIGLAAVFTALALTAPFGRRPRSP